MRLIIFACLSLLLSGCLLSRPSVEPIVMIRPLIPERDIAADQTEAHGVRIMDFTQSTHIGLSLLISNAQGVRRTHPTYRWTEWPGTLMTQAMILAVDADPRLTRRDSTRSTRVRGLVTGLVVRPESKELELELRLGMRRPNRDQANTLISVKVAVSDPENPSELAQAAGEAIAQATEMALTWVVEETAQGQSVK